MANAQGPRGGPGSNQHALKPPRPAATATLEPVPVRAVADDPFADAAVGATRTWAHSGDLDPATYAGAGWAHLGTRDAAGQRAAMYPERALWHVRVAPTAPVGSEHDPVDDFDANRIDQWLAIGAPRTADGDPTIPREHVSNSRDVQWLRDAVAATGFDPDVHDAVYYRNGVEDAGSVSVMVRPDRIAARRQVHGGQMRLPCTEEPR